MFNDDALRIELDRPEVDSGETIAGRVVLRLEKAHTCTIRVELGWKITSKGNKVGEVLETQNIFTGDLAAGEHSFPFGLQAPNGPFTYDGTIMDLEWYVSGRADIPWKVDPKASAVFKLNPGEVGGEGNLPVVVGSVKEALEENAGANMILAGVGLVMFLTGLGVLAVNVYFGVGSIVVGLGFAVPLLVKKPVEKVRLTFEPKVVRAGTPLRWRASFRLHPKVVINHAKVVFECREFVTKGSGKHTQHWTEVVFRHEEALPLGVKPPFEGRFEVPHLQSFSFNSHELYWTIGLHIDIANWPDFHVETKFKVLLPLERLSLVGADDSTELSW